MRLLSTLPTPPPPLPPSPTPPPRRVALSQKQTAFSVRSRSSQCNTQWPFCRNSLTATVPWSHVYSRINRVSISFGSIITWIAFVIPLICRHYTVYILVGIVPYIFALHFACTIRVQSDHYGQYIFFIFFLILSLDHVFWLKVNWLIFWDFWPRGFRRDILSESPSESPCDSPVMTIRGSHWREPLTQCHWHSVTLSFSLYSHVPMWMSQPLWRYWRTLFVFWKCQPVTSLIPLITSISSSDPSDFRFVGQKWTRWCNERTSTIQ